MIAKFYDVAPWELADVPADWLAVADTIMAAEAGAAHERQVRHDRLAKLRGSGRRGGLG